MSMIKTSAILVKSRKYKEKDKILTFYSEDLGKIVARCKGARDPMNHWGHTTEPPNVCWLQLYEKNGYYIVTEMKPIFNLFTVSTDLKRLIAFETFVGILDQFIEEHVPSQNFFNTCLSFLTFLNKEETDPMYLSYQFVYTYLVWQGLPIMVDKCVHCQELLEKGKEGYSLCYEGAGLFCPSCAAKMSVFNPISSKLITVLHEFVKSNPFVERKRMDDFFQNCEDLDRIVKEYYHFLFGKKLVTYNSLKKL